MSRVSLWMATVISAVLLAGACGPGATPPVEEATPAEEEGKAEAPAGEKIELVVWHAGTAPPLEKGMEALVASFEEANPNIDVQIEVFPFGEYFQKIATASAAGTAPDVFWSDVTRVAEYGRLGITMPLDEFIPEGDLEDYYEAPREDMTYRDTIYSYPMHQSTEAILYNPEIIGAAGLNPPRSYDEAWTWEEFVEALEKVTKRSGEVTEVWGYATHYPPSEYSAQPYVHAHGGRLISPDGSTFQGHLDSEATVEAIEWWTSLWDEHKVAPVSAIPDIFQTGRVAFYQANPFVLRDIEQRFPDLEIGVMPLPCDETCGVPSGGWHIAIHPQTEHPEEAWQLLHWIVRPEGHTQWIDMTGYMPARKSAYEALDWVKEYPWNIFWEGLEKYPVRRPQTPVYSLFADQFTQKMVIDAQLGADVADKAEEVVGAVEPEHQKVNR